MEADIDLSAIEDLVRSVLDETERITLEEMETATEDIYSEAVLDWPVKTGRSKKALKWGTRFSGDFVETFIENPIDYVYYIKGDVQGGRSTWVTLVRRPVKKAEKTIAREVEKRLSDLEK